MRHKDKLDSLTDEDLINWYEGCQPAGSGPISLMQMICILIEEIAEERGIELPPAKGIS